MNKVYKVIWNRTKQCYIVVSEFAKQAGKVKSTHLFAAMGKTTVAVGLGAALLFPLGGMNASAAAGKVIGGDATSSAEGEDATISGGSNNHAKGMNSSVSGGADNQAFGKDSSVSGGGQNMATGQGSSVTGGTQNQAGGHFATVSGGTDNKAFGWGSIVIGGAGNVTGKVAVNDNGESLKDANGNQYSADQGINFFGQGSVAIGGLSSSVQGNYSVGIAGGSTSADAGSGLAAGKQATVTVANGVAIGYESTASVINSSRTADTEGRIVSFGHQKDDVYYDVDYHNHTVTEKKYTSDAYNRLVNVADGIDDHDVVVMKQLEKAKAAAVETAKNQIKVKGDEVNVHAKETTGKDGVQTTTISLKPKVTLKESTDITGANQVVLDGTAGTISAGLSTDQQNYISLNGTTGVAKVGAVEIGNQSFTYTYDKPDGMNDNGTVKLTSTLANAKGTFVTGLSNKTWTPGNYASGRAATEDQLEKAGRHFLSIKTATTDKDGNPITPAEENTLANYYNDGATGSASMAFGVETKASGDQSLAMGAKSSASGLNSLAIGYGNEAAGTKSVAVGNSTHASGNFSVAMGLGAQAGTKNTDVTSTDHGAAVAVGYSASAAETGSAAYGYSAKANEVESSAFGTSAQAKTEGSIALGAHSVANREKGSIGYLAPDTTATWVSTSGAVSLGTDAAGTTISRQITNLAAGSEDSDAVNVAQLKAVESKGLNFQGNDTMTSVHLNQGDTLQIQGSGRKDDEEYSTQNVKVLTDTANNRLSIALDKNPNFDSVTAGTEVTSADGGKAGSIKIVGADSSNVNKATTITAGYAASPELSGTNGTGRISYTDGDGTAHTVATLGDGLKLAGDTGTGSVALDNTLTVSGGAKNLADGSNIGVTANGSALSLKLAKNVTGLETITAGGAKLGTQTDGNATTKSGDYLTGLDNTTWTVGQTQLVTGRAATEDQLKNVSDVVNSNKTQITTNADNIDKGLNFSASNKVDGAYKTVKKNLGGTVAVRANDAQKDHTYKTDNLTTEIDDTGIITVKMDTQLTADKVTVGTGDKAITINGSNGSLNTGSSTLNGTGLTITNGPSVTTGGISGGNQKMTHVASGKSGDDNFGNPVYGIETNAANIGDVKKIAAKTVTVSGDKKNTKVDKNVHTDGTVNYQVSLKDSVTLGSDAAKKIALDGTAGTVSVGDKITLNGNAGTAAIGGATLGNDGTNTYLTGLTNKTWEPNNITSGRAATEDQLYTVSKSIQATVNGATFAIMAGGQGEATDATITKKVGESIRIFGDAPKVSGGGDGDGWDHSKANILTKVKKDNHGDSYVSVELQDHLEVGTHAGTDTDGTTITGVDGSMQFKGASAKEVNITGDTGVTLSNNGSTAAALRQDKGTGYLDLTGTTAGTKASVSVHTGAKNLAQQYQTRLTYTDQDSKAHDVATLDDGLIFAGDTGTVSRALNSTLKLSGGVSNASDLSSGNNIGVTAGDGTLKLQLAKNLTGIDSITGLKNITIGSDFATQGRAATEEQLKLMQSNITSSITQSAQGGGFALTSDEKGDDKIVKQDLGKAIQIKGDTTYKADGSVEKEGNIKTSIDNGAIKVGLNKDVDLGKDGSIKAGGVTISNKGIDAGNKNITNVKSGIVNHNDSDNSNAANIGDVKKLAGEAAQGAVDSLGTRDFTGDDGEKISRKLGESMKLSGGADTSKLTDKNIGVVKNADGTGLDIKLSSELKGLTSVTTGNSTLNNGGLTINNSEGKAGTTITSSGIKIAANGDNTHVVEISNSNVSMGGQQIHDVAAGTSATDAVNVGQLSMFANNVGSAINKLDNRVNRVGAGASALAALHPLDFDPDDKWDFAGGFGHYKNANAAAIGAYYRPNENTMFSIGGSIGGGENMVNAGVSFKLGQGTTFRHRVR